MTAGRYRLLGLAQARSAWFRDLSRWSTNAALPVEFVKCMAIEELRGPPRLGSGASRRSSSTAASPASTATWSTGPARPARRWSWSTTGAVASTGPRWVSTPCCPSRSTGPMLLSALDRVRAGHRGPRRSSPATALAPPPAGWRGRLVAVTGPGRRWRRRRWPWRWPRASARRRATRGWSCWPTSPCTPTWPCCTTPATSCPASRSWSRPTALDHPAVDQVRSHAFDVDGRGYDLLLGLRRHRDWPVLRPRAVQAAVDGLLRSYRLVVADVDADLEGDDEVGSVDVEERNVLARTAAARADLVLVVAPPTLVGLRRLVLHARRARTAFGVDRRPAAAGRHPGAAAGRGRAEITDAIGRRSSPGCGPSWPPTLALAGVRARAPRPRRAATAPPCRCPTAPGAARHRRRSRRCSTGPRSCRPASTPIEPVRGRAGLARLVGRRRRRPDERAPASAPVGQRPLKFGGPLLEEGPRALPWRPRWP